MRPAFFFLLLICAAIICPQAHSQPVCAVVSPFLPMFSSKGMSDFLLLGPQKALNDYKMNTKDAIFVSAADDVDLMKTVNRAYSQGCRIIVGLYTSKECLLAATTLREQAVVLLSPTCGHDDLRKHKGIIYTGVPSIEDYAKEESKYLDAKQFNQIYIVHNPADLYSQNVLKFFRENLKSPSTLIPIRRDGSLANKPQLQPKSAIVFTTYPKDSGPAIEIFSKHELANQTIMMAGLSWIYDLTILMHRRAQLKKFRAVLIAKTDNKSRIKDPMISLKAPRSLKNIVISSYDIMSFALDCYSKTKTEFNLKRFKNCMNKTIFNGVTGTIEYKRGGPFAERNIIFSDLFEEL